MDPIEQAEIGNTDFFKIAETQGILQARDDGSYGGSVLFQAAISGHVECSKVIMGRWPELLYVAAKNGSTPLNEVVWRQQIEFVRLFSVGVDKKLFRMAFSTNTPLHKAVDLGNLDIVKILVEADPDFESTPANNSGETPQELAVRLASPAKDKAEIRVQIKEYIIKKIEEKRAPPRDLKTEPIDRATKGDAEFFMRVEYEAGINSRDKKGNSVLAVAVLNGHFECSEVILKRFPELLYVENTNEKRAPLHHAVWRGNSEIVELLVLGADKKLLRMQNISGDTPVHMAISGKRFEIVKILIKADPDYNEISANNKGETPVMMATNDLGAKIRDLVVGKQTGNTNTEEETSSVNKVLPTAREHGISIPLKYIDLYSRLVKQYGEIVPLEMDESEAGAIGNALANFLDMVAEMQVEIPAFMSKEKLSSWEHKCFSYAEWGLQINWFRDRIEWYMDILDKRVTA